MHYTNIKSFTQSLKITLLNKTKQQDSWIHKNLIPNNVKIPLTDLESHQEQHRSTRTTKPDGGSP